MKQNILILLILNCLLLTSYSQDEENLKGEFYLAPDFGLTFGTISRIEVSPVLGYHITDRFNIAGGFKYEFYSLTNAYNQDNFRTHIYGPRAFARYTLFKNIGKYLPVGMSTQLFAHAEFESSSLESKYFGSYSNPDSGRFWQSTLLVGGGISQSASERVKLNVVILWDTDGSSKSMYSNPIIRFGFQFYLRPKKEEFW